ncbi:acyl-coenzyme A diphosphatase FITM2 [Neodiprion pinetum]|uniref:acyl-coenzyme A diphosphatase FITM2 n=1 Tax=Neodiprion pinetum TaxID=441929 RepID=UPI001EE06EDA|nr:acyl-coenzyme A diphosphatase FITM2 [Neodiprion pinetum]
MATGKRRPLHPSTGGSGIPSSANLNFRPNVNTEDRGGTRPTSTPSSVGLVLVTMLIHLCKKWLLFDTRLRVAFYCGALFLVSIVADFIPMPRTYFSRTDTFFNQFFVKWAWGWLLSVIIPWVTLTAYTLGCGRRVILAKHLGRAIFATVAWFMWTTTFRMIENHFGRCLNTRDPQLQSRFTCLQAGRFWSGLDISGHAFILVYSSLILAEEGSTLIGWEGISDLIMREEHNRNTMAEATSRPLRTLSTSDLAFLKKTHQALTPYLRALFVAMTLQQLLWDLMLSTTILYFHSMVEKLLGGLAAILTWYITYHWWYKLPKMSLSAPSEGLFKYNDLKPTRDPAAARTRRGTLNGSGPRFMGMPLRTSQEYTEFQSSTRQSEAEPVN